MRRAVLVGLTGMVGAALPTVLRALRAATAVRPSPEAPVTVGTGATENEAPAIPAQPTRSGLALLVEDDTEDDVAVAEHEERDSRVLRALDGARQRSTTTR